MNKKAATLALSSALALGLTGCMSHGSSPDFQANDMKSGYQNGEKSADGKCGSGSCGSNHETSSNESKSADGKCGEGSCGSKDGSSTSGSSQ